MDFSYTTVTLEQVLTDFQYALKTPSCVPCCFEDLCGGWTTDTFKQIIVKITKNGRIPLPLVVYEPNQLGFLSNKQNCLEEVFKLFDTRGMGRIDLLELLCGVSFATSGTMENKLMNAFLIFGFKDSGTVSIDEFHIFLDWLVKSIYKITLRSDDTFYPRHPNFKLGYQEIEQLCAQVFQRSKNITVKEFDEWLQREQGSLLSKLIYFFSQKFQNSVEYTRAIMVDRIKIIPFIKNLLYNKIFAPAMAKISQYKIKLKIETADRTYSIKMAVLILYSAILSLIIEFANAQDWVGDTILPLFPGEVDYHPGLRATFYFIGMVWFFLGIAIAADKFMEAISVITSKTKKIYVNGEEIDVVVWNETVANLTLMALGSSAPEILLATIETVALGFEAGELGPGTIVGSAAFNLLVIISICVVFVPNEDLLDKDKETGTRAIKEMGVFAITASFSIFAYIWLFIVLTVTSPDEIELWEALMTLVFFPLLVLMAYMQDKKLFQQCRRGTRTSNKSLVTNRTLQGKVIDARMGSRPDQALIDAMRNEETHILSNEVVSHLAARHVLQNVRHNRLSYRLQASRAVTGRKNLMPSAENTNEESHKKIVNVGFTAGHYSVMENEGKIVLHVKRDGDQIDECTVEYHTQDGTAIAGKEYEAASGTLKFSSMKETQTITINIIDNEEPQPDRVFQVVLSEPQFVKQQASDYFRLSLKTDHAQVTIVDDDHPGIFQFTQPTFAATPQEPEVSILVKRTNGAKGHIDIEYQTREGNAEVDIDYINSHGTLSFEPGEAEKSINIPILPNARFEKDLTFSIDLLLPKDPNVQLGRLSSVTVTLTNDENFKNIVDKFAEMLKDQEDALRIGSETWGEQFTQAMSLPEPEEGEELTRMDYVLHALSFYWKIILAVIPPTSYWSGWATFLVSLVMIGIITALVGDLAGMFGCCIGISKPVTAITFIALGTSIPDTFASKLAATSDPHADAAIGNVTGSNSVNVFLGLGFPWTLAAIYHAANGTTYEVPAGSLAFSVAVFTICALICLALLVIKRKLMGAELGGKGFWRYGLGIILAALWFIYVLLSSLENYGHIF